jgi:hypothetical protein
VGGVNQRLGCGFVHAGQADVHAHGNAVGVGDGAQVHFGVNRQICRQGGLHLAGHSLHGADEAGGVTGGKQLLGVGARARGARGRQRDVQAAVIGFGGAVTAAGGVGFGGVEDFFEGWSW